MQTAVMQPYFFPYIGYFQMVNAVDVFVFYDDVNFIKRGWINRNKILINGQDRLISIPCIKASQNKLVNEVHFDRNHKEYRNLLKTIGQAYKKAPCFDRVFPLIEHILNLQTDKISELAQHSVEQISRYLEIDTEFKTSSINFPETQGNDKADRLIAICKDVEAKEYINAIGGEKLYKKSYFEKEGIQLNFIESLPIEYQQFKNDFVPYLSIIDVLMFNSVEETKKLLNSYRLI